MRLWQNPFIISREIQVDSKILHNWQKGHGSDGGAKLLKRAAPRGADKTAKVPSSLCLLLPRGINAECGATRCHAGCGIVPSLSGSSRTPAQEPHITRCIVGSFCTINSRVRSQCAETLPPLLLLPGLSVGRCVPARTTALARLHNLTNAPSCRCGSPGWPA